MERPKQVVLPILTTHRISSSSSSMSGTQSARGQELSPVRFNNTTSEIYDQRRPKELESALRASMELRSFSPIPLQRPLPDSEALQRALGSQIIPKPPDRKLEAGGRYERRSGRELKVVGNVKGLSKSKTPPKGHNPRRTKSPIDSSRNSTAQPHQGQTPSNPHSEFTSPKPPEPVPNAREQLASLVLESIKANSIPIALESKQVNKKVMLVPTAEPEDISGNLVFTKQGFFEIPKERGATSRFISKKEFAMATMNFDILSKLPFVQNYHKHKQLRLWRLKARNMWFSTRKKQLYQDLWLSKPLLTSKMPTFLESLNDIKEIRAIDIHENYMYGKRHTDFYSRQTLMLSTASGQFEQESNKLMQAISAISQELAAFQQKEEDEFVYQKMTEKLERRKGDDIGLSSNKKSAMEEKIREEKKSTQDKSFDRFLLWVLVAYQHAVVTAIRQNARFLERTTLSNRRPRFEVFLQASPKLEFDPTLSYLRDMHHNTVQRLHSHFCNHSCITQLHWLVVSSFHLRTNPNTDLKAYKEFISQEGMNSEVISSLGKMQKNIDIDLSAVEKWSKNYTHLEELRLKADQWIRMTNQSMDIIAFYRENFSELNSYQETVSAIPTNSVNIGMFTVETTLVRSELLELPTHVYRLLHDRLQSVVSIESADLRGEVYIHYSMLDERAATLPQYAQQLQSLSDLKSDKLQKLTLRLDFLQECVKLCRKENIRIPAPVQLDCDDARIMLTQLPEKIAKTEAACLESKSFFEQQITRNAEKLSRKICKFEEKYKEHYLTDAGKINTAELVLKDLEKRENALATIKQRVEVFANFEAVLAGKEGLSCVSDFKRVFDLHCDTLKCWKLVTYLNKNKEIWYQSPFIDLNFKKIRHKLKKIGDKIAPEEFNLKEISESQVIKALQQQISDFSELIDALILLKDETLKPRHWEKIFQMLRKPHLINTGFTLKDLKDAKIVRFIGKISAILEEAKIESKQETELIEIKKTWETAVVETESYRNRLDIYIVTNGEKLLYWIEEHMAVLEALEQTRNTEHMKGDIREWKEKLEVMGETMEVWRKCQEAWLLLEPIFTSEQLGSTQPKDYSIFKEVQSNLKKVMWAAHQSPKALSNLLAPGRLEILSSVLSACEILRKTVKDFLETRRIAYPRFFFFSDSQLLEFLSKVHAGLKFDHCLTAIFPGIQGLYIRKSSEEVYDCDPELAPFNKFSPAGDELLDPFDFSSEGSKSSSRHSDSENEAPPERSALVLEKQKRLRDQHQQPSGDWSNAAPSDIFGVVGHNEDVLLLETPVPVHAGVETWMSELEMEIATTLKKLVSAAISSFPKQSLDEWILDYPIQTILTTITLIITHEITELLTSFRSQSPSHDAGTLDPSYSELIDEPVTEKYESHFSKVFFSSHQESQSVMDQSRQALVKLLQAKTYKGLYLRLQFWVNQIANNIRADVKAGKRLQPLHRLNLHNFVTSLLYQRDLVYGLHKKKIRSEEDFEWRKLLRVYLGASDSCCRVECGGWGMVQEQEYLGASMRLLCTPETTRYYLYLSSVLRESGSVLFRPQPGSDTMKEAVAEFANAMGVCCQFIPLTLSSSTSLVMNFLNGAALAHVWLCLEGVTSLPLHALHAVIRETQMVKQQFLIAGVSEPSSQQIPADSHIEDPSSIVDKSKPEESSGLPGALDSLSQIQVEGTVVQKSITQTLSGSQSSALEEDSEVSDRKLTPVIRSNSNMFVVFSSLSLTTLPENHEFLQSAKVTFRVKELVKPPYLFTLSGLLLLKNFKTARYLATKSHDILMQLLPFHIHTSLRDLYRIVSLAKVNFDTVSEDDRPEIEEEAMSSALLTWAISKSYPKDVNFTDKSSKSAYKLYISDIESIIKRQFPRSKISFSQKNIQIGIQEATARLKFGFQDWQEQLVKQLFQLILMHRVVVISGSKGCGKTTCTRILLEMLRKEGEVAHIPVNPEVIGVSGMFGSYDAEENRPGVLETAFHSHGALPILHLQSDQPSNWWLEPLLPLSNSSILTHSELNSMDVPEVLETCKGMFRGADMELRLPNGVCLQAPPALGVVCEVTDVSQMCVSTVTSFGRLYISTHDLNWDILMTPTASELADKFTPNGLTSALILKLFTDRLKPLIESCDSRFNSNGNWDICRQMHAFTGLLTSVMQASAGMMLPQLAESEGIDVTNLMDFRRFIQENETHAKVKEAKEVLSLAMTIAFVWSFGGGINAKERVVLSQMMTEGRSLMLAKYMYPRSENAFEYYFDWKNKEFRRFDKSDVARLSANATYDSATKILCVPTLPFLQVKYACQMGLFGSYDGMLTNTHQEPVWIEIQGVEGAGKSACIQYITREFQQYISSNACSVSNLLTYEKFTATAFPLFAWKMRTVGSALNDRKAVVVVDDMHLEESGRRLTQSIEFVMGFKGCYDPKDNVFKTIKDLSFVSLSHPRKVSHCLCLSLDPPDSPSMKEIMTVYIFSRKFTTDSIVHRWSTTLIQVLLSARKVPEVKVQIGPHRVFTTLTRLVQATLRLETSE